MAKFYYTRILLGKMVLEDVPSKWREAVAALLEDE